VKDLLPLLFLNTPSVPLHVTPFATAFITQFDVMDSAIRRRRNTRV
jgi:hypothetical protein